MAHGRSLAGLLALAVLSTAPAPAGAVVSAAPEAVSVTIYRDHPATTADLAGSQAGDGGRNGGVAMITETRTVVIAPGDDRIVFKDVADGMVAQTAKLEGLPARIAEQNFDYSLLSPRSLLENSVGRTVRFVRTNPRTGKLTEQKAKVVSAPEGVVLETSDGIDTLHCSGLPERLIFDHMPEGLNDRPTLSLRAPGVKPGRYKVRLSYLATGLDWSADYVAHVGAGGRTLELSGLITLVNRGSVSFRNAPTQVVAGKWRKVPGDGTDHRPVRARPYPLNCWAIPSDRPPPVLEIVHPMRVMAPAQAVMAMAPPAPPPPARAMVKAAELGDYKLYSLPQPTTVAARQTKQVGLIDQDGVAFDWIYGFVVNGSAVEQPRAAAELRLRMQNTKAANLGKALPAGMVSVVQDDAEGRPVLIGRRKLDDVPVGLPIDLTLGRAPDVGVSARVTANQRIDKGRVRLEREVLVVNDRATPITFELSHPIYWRHFKITSESLSHRMWRGMPTWTLTLEPGARQTVRYSYEQDG